MKKYILPLLFSLQAIILLLCLVGFSLLKKPLLELDPKNRAAFGTVGSGNPEAIVGFTVAEVTLRQKGESLFKANCTTCHLRNRKVIGPKLEDLCKKYASPQEREWLISWIQNSQDLIRNKKYPQAIALWEANNKAVMPAFPSLAEMDIKAIMAYLDPTCLKP